MQLDRNNNVTPLRECGASGRLNVSRYLQLIRPVLWALGKRKRSALAHATSKNDTQSSDRDVELVELSTSIPCQCLQASIFIKRRLYIVSQDPRLLWQAKTLESELRRRLQEARAAMLEARDAVQCDLIPQ
jgi:hypothetical protein